METQFTLERVKQTAELVVKRLAPYCKKIEMAGSVRRGRRWVHDADIILIPRDSWNLYQEILALNRPFKPKPDGPKIKRISVGGIPIDLYIADERNWATLLLIRTGSVASNKKLCARAQELGWTLHADGSGLFDKEGKRIAGDTEISIFNALGLEYQPPNKRE